MERISLGNLVVNLSQQVLIFFGKFVNLRTWCTFERKSWTPEDQGHFQRMCNEPNRSLKVVQLIWP